MPKPIDSGAARPLALALLVWQWRPIAERPQHHDADRFHGRSHGGYHA